MDLTVLKNLFEGYATRHVLIMHGKEVNGKKRRSYFRNEIEVQGSDSTNIAYPFLLLPLPTGQLSDNGDLINDVQAISFEIRDYAKDILEHDAIDALQDKCKQIGEQILALMDQTRQEEYNSGPIPYFDVSSVQYEFTGPINNNQYGCRFRFNIEDEAWDRMVFDARQFFDPETIV